MVLKFREVFILALVAIYYTQEIYAGTKKTNNTKVRPKRAQKGNLRHSYSEDETDQSPAYDDSQGSDYSEETNERMNVKAREDSDDYNEVDGDLSETDSEYESEDLTQYNGEGNKNCWLSLNGAAIFRAMNDLSNKYSKVLKDYENAVGDKMDKQMLEALLGTSGAAHRAIRHFGGAFREIPAGINLGGYCMLRQHDSLLFFHRMKLRNSTIFRVDQLHHDFVNMALIVSLTLHDLHLVGAYERAPTDTDPSVLFYRPTAGSLEILLKNVTYKVEARMRFMFDRITVELINSGMNADDVLMTFLNTNADQRTNANCSNPDTERIAADDIDDFMERLKTDLDLWMKDYFNDYFMLYDLPKQDNTKIQESEKKKAMYLDEFAIYATNAIRQGVAEQGGGAIRVPKFSLYTVPGMVVKLKEGVLYGLDSMFPRSAATAMTKYFKRDKMLVVDFMVTFSSLKVVYNMEVSQPEGAPPLSGLLTLMVGDLAVHLSVVLVEGQDTVDLDFDLIQHMKPEYLTIEGPVNRIIANYQHLLENQILAIMTNVLMHNIKMLRSLPRCTPFLFSNYNSKKEEDDSDYSEYVDSNEVLYYKGDSDGIETGDSDYDSDDSNVSELRGEYDSYEIEGSNDYDEEGENYESEGNNEYSGSDGRRRQNKRKGRVLKRSHHNIKRMRPNKKT